jgi:hypothetical protein
LWNSRSTSTAEHRGRRRSDGSGQLRLNASIPPVEVPAKKSKRLLTGSPVRASISARMMAGTIPRTPPASMLSIFFIWWPGPVEHLSMIVNRTKGPGQGCFPPAGHPVLLILPSGFRLLRHRQGIRSDLLPNDAGKPLRPALRRQCKNRCRGDPTRDDIGK